MKKKKEEYFFDDIDNSEDDMISLLDKYDTIEEEQNDSLLNEDDKIDLKELKKEKKSKPKKEPIEKLEEEKEEKIQEEEPAEEQKEKQEEPVEELDEEPAEEQKEKPKKKIKEEKKNETPEILISLTGFIAIGYYIYYVIQSLSDINYVLKIANATLLLVALLFSIAAFINKEKTKKRDIMTIFVSIILVLFLGFNLLVSTKILKLPTLPVLEDFTNKSLVKVLNFTNDNEIVLKQEYEYSDNVKEGYIISQDKKPDTKIKEIKKLSVVVSSGPNYDKELVLTDFVGLKVDDVIKFVKKNFMNNTNIDFTVRDDVEKDIVISQSTKGDIKRNTKVNFLVSLGRAEDLPEIELDNLKGKSLFEATLYLKRNGIKYELKYDFSNKIKRDYIISQDIKAKTKVKPGTDKVILTVSNGKEIKVPDFAGKTSDDVVSWVVKNNLKLSFQEKFHVSVKKGNLIGINYEPGLSIAEGTKILITTSLGPVLVPKFTSLAALRTWAAENGVNVSESYDYSKDVAKGNIINVNYKEGDKIDPAKDSLIVSVSQGSPITVPYFVGKNKSSIQTQCRNLGLNCTFYYVGYNNNPVNTAIAQNVNSGLKVVSGTYVNIGLSSGPAKVFHVYIDDTYLSFGSADASIQTLRARLQSVAPGVGFNFYKKSVSGDMTPGMIHPDSPIKGGRYNDFKQGVTYNIYIIA